MPHFSPFSIAAAARDADDAADADAADADAAAFFSMTLIIIDG